MSVKSWAQRFRDENIDAMESTIKPFLQPEVDLIKLFGSEFTQTFL
jgi:hypothetical protein